MPHDIGALINKKSVDLIGLYFSIVFSSGRLCGTGGNYIQAPHCPKQYCEVGLALGNLYSFLEFCLLLHRFRLVDLCMLFFGGVCTAWP